MTATNLIFLDVDGVLNKNHDHPLMVRTNRAFVREELVSILARIIQETDARIVLSSTWRLTEELADIVRSEISHALRALEYSNLGRANQDSGEIPLEAYDDIIISYTPDLSHKLYKEKPPSHISHQTRTDEIILWLKENAELPVDIGVKKGCPEHSRKVARKGDIEENKWILTKKIRVKNFICIDDIDLSRISCYNRKSRMSEHLIHTRTDTGLTKDHFQRALEVLRNPKFNFFYWAEQCFVECDKRNCFHKKMRENEKLLEEYKRLSIDPSFTLPKTANRSRTHPEKELKEKKKLSIESAPVTRFVEEDASEYL